MGEHGRLHSEGQDEAPGFQRATGRGDSAGAAPTPGLARVGGAMSVLALQRAAGNRAVSHAMNNRAVSVSSPLRRPTVQRDGPAAPAGAGPAAAPATATTPAGATGLIVEDDVADLRPEQMRRSAFLAQARTAAADGANAALGPLAEQSAGELESTAARYSGQKAAQLEASIRAEVPGAAGAASAAGLVEAVRTAAGTEARSRMSAGVSDAAAGAVDSVVGAASQIASSISGLFFKPKDGAAPSAGAAEVATARSVMGAGERVPSGLRSEVERVTGADLGDVRVHRSPVSSEVAADMGARAFTVGTDIVVSGDEPAAGTPHGDALLAHELAHAAQQSGAGSTGAAEKSHDGGHADAGEVSADDVAAESVMGLWAGLRGQLAGAGRELGTRVKSGLRLQRCSKKAEPAPPTIDPSKEALNKKVMEGMDQANNGPKDANRGVWYPFRYQPAYPAEWAKMGSPSGGYANKTYWEMTGFMTFKRKPGMSASAAMDAWFAGPTIADCASVATASEINALRAALGDAAFDKAFGGENKPAEMGEPQFRGGKRQRRDLLIGQGMDHSMIEDLMMETASAKDAGVEGKRNVQPGEWHYFANHPDYPKRHATGFWQGENALYQGEVNGEQMWSGFGATSNEKDMNETLVSEYKRAPTQESIDTKKSYYDKYGADVDKWPDHLKKFHGEAAGDMTVEKMLAAGGGFAGAKGQQLDPAKVQALKDRLSK